MSNPDAPPPAWKADLERFRRLTPEERLHRAFVASAAARAQSRQWLRQKYPNATEREIFLRDARNTLGEELFRKVYGAELPE